MRRNARQSASAGGERPSVTGDLGVAKSSFHKGPEHRLKESLGCGRAPGMPYTHFSILPPSVDTLITESLEPSTGPGRGRE